MLVFGKWGESNPRLMLSACTLLILYKAQKLLQAHLLVTGWLREPEKTDGR